MGLIGYAIHRGEGLWLTLCLGPFGLIVALWRSHLKIKAKFAHIEEVAEEIVDEDPITGRIR